MNRKKEKTEKENRKLSSVCNSINNNSSSNELYIIWQKDKTNKTIQSEDKVLAKKNGDSQVENKDNKQDIETRLENILSNIKGVGNVKVLITYSQESTVIQCMTKIHQQA